MLNQFESPAALLNPKGGAILSQRFILIGQGFYLSTIASNKSNNTAVSSL